jgi:hypothetical protein
MDGQREDGGSSVIVGTDMVSALELIDRADLLKL